MISSPTQRCTMLMCIISAAFLVLAQQACAYRIDMFAILGNNNLTAVARYLNVTKDVCDIRVRTLLSTASAPTQSTAGTETEALTILAHA
jgi:hypothetical protein